MPHTPTEKAAPGLRNFLPIAVLSGVVLLLAMLFFQVVRPMFVPLFMAAVLAMLAKPLHDRCAKLLGNRPRSAAALLTILLVGMMFGPIATAVYFAVGDLRLALDHLGAFVASGELESLSNPEEQSELNVVIDRWLSWLPVDPVQVRVRFAETLSGLGETLYETSKDFIGSLPRSLVGFLMFIIAFYFFMVDGQKIVRGWEDLTPMDSEHDRILREEFAKVCRGVVYATVVASLVQGIALGLGIAVIDLIFSCGIGRWTILISVLTVVFAMIPFVGAAAVWAVLAVYLFALNQVAAAICLALYGAAFVSTIDNVIKIVVIGESANLHPLLVFVSVIGGIQLVGILGVFVGPIAAAVLFALLKVLKRELVQMTGDPTGGLPLASGSASAPSVPANPKS